jgi:hypothetical protein
LQNLVAGLAHHGNQVAAKGGKRFEAGGKHHRVHHVDQAQGGTGELAQRDGFVQPLARCRAAVNRHQDLLIHDAVPSWKSIFQWHACRPVQGEAAGIEAPQVARGGRLQPAQETGSQISLRRKNQGMNGGS